MKFRYSLLNFILNEVPHTVTRGVIGPTRSQRGTEMDGEKFTSTRRNTSRVATLICIIPPKRGISLRRCIDAAIASVKWNEMKWNDGSVDSVAKWYVSRVYRQNRPFDGRFKRYIVTSYCLRITSNKNAIVKLVVKIDTTEFRLFFSALIDAIIRQIILSAVKYFQEKFSIGPTPVAKWWRIISRSRPALSITVVFSAANNFADADNNHIGKNSR